MLYCIVDRIEQSFFGIKIRIHIIGTYTEPNVWNQKRNQIGKANNRNDSLQAVDFGCIVNRNNLNHQCYDDNNRKKIKRTF